MTLEDRFPAWRRRWEAGDRSVLEELVEFLEEARDRGGTYDHAACGALCEQVGLMRQAFHQFQQALAQHPDDARLLEKLAAYYAERGDLRRAGELWRRQLELEPHDGETFDELARLLAAEEAEPALRELLEWGEAAGVPAEKIAAWRSTLGQQRRDAAADDAAIPTRDDPFPEPNDADCVRMATLFAGREDVYARQWCRSDDRRVGYTPVHEPLTPAVVRRHLLGAVTVGVYPIRLDQTATWFAVDLDIRRNELEAARRNHAYATELRDAMKATGIALLKKLRQLGLEPLFENSGYKGRHYWVFLGQPQEARTLHHLGRLLLGFLQPEVPPPFSLEFFPKQARRTGKGLGNLIKLPLGIHQRTGYRSVLLDESGRPVDDPYDVLRRVVRLSQEDFGRLVDRLKGAAPRPAAPGEAEIGEEDAAAAAEESAAVPLWPPDAPPPWTEADFETDREVHHVLSHCPVLAALKEQVDRHRQLSHDEQVVLIHTMGHLMGGPQAVNYLLHRCVEYAPEMLMKSRLKGNPISCPKIRKRIGHVTRRVPCACDFSFAPNHYPTPVLHLETLPPEPAGEKKEKGSPSGDGESLERLIQRYTVLVHRRDELEREWRELHDAICRRLAALPDRSIATEEGRFYLVTEEGVESLRWEASREG